MGDVVSHVGGDSHGSQDTHDNGCKTTGGNSNGATCAFPFTYDGVTHNKCISYGSQSWCATSLDYEQDGFWGYCDPDTCNEATRVNGMDVGGQGQTCATEGGSGEGRNCRFPFTYKGSEYNNCISYGTKAWCSVSENYDSDGLWGYCNCN